MNRMTTSAAVMTVLFNLFAVAALADERGGAHYRSTGDSWAGGSIQTWSSTYNQNGTNDKQTRVQETTNGRVSLFNQSATAYEVGIDVSRVISSGGDWRYAKLNVKVGPYSVIADQNGAGISKTWSWNLEFFRAGVTIWVGPVPVYVEGAVGVGFAVNASIQINPTAGNVTVNGSAGGSFYGRVLGGLGCWGFGIGIEAKMSFVGGALESSMTLGFSARTGYVRIRYYAGDLKINVVVWIWWGRWSVTIFSKTFGAWSPIYLLNF